MLISPEQFFGFLAAALLITASPGPDNLMVLGCDWVRLYLISNPNASASQKKVCGITRKP